MVDVAGSGGRSPQIDDIGEGHYGHYGVTEKQPCYIMFLYFGPLIQCNATHSVCQLCAVCKQT